jgi:hypothetical protein
VSNKQRATQDTRWQIELHDGAVVRCTGMLEVTRKKTALVWYDECGKRFLVFGAQRQMVRSIEAVEENDER